MSFIKRPAAMLSSAILFAIIAGGASAQQRTVLQTIDYPADHQILMVIAELEPGQCTSRHAHPGFESAYVLEGEAVAQFDNKPDLHLKAGQPLQFAPNEMHNVCNHGSVRFKALAHYIVEKGKPLKILP